MESTKKPGKGGAVRDIVSQFAQQLMLEEKRQLSEKVCRHREAIVRAVGFGISNARIEAINIKIKVIMRMGYGFRNTDSLIALVMLRCSRVRVALPGRA